MKKRILAIILIQALTAGNPAVTAYAADTGVGYFKQSEESFPESLPDSDETVAAPLSDSDETAAEPLPDSDETAAEPQNAPASAFPERTPCADVTECADAEAFADALADINREYPCAFDGEIVLDIREGTVTDENGEELVGAGSLIGEVLLEEDPEEAAQILTENGYSNVTVEDGIIRADDRYECGRLFVTSTEPVDTAGALSVVSYGETSLMQYASSEEAAAAAEMLGDDPGVREVIPDFVMRCGGQEAVWTEPEESADTGVPPETAGPPTEESTDTEAPAALVTTSDTPETAQVTTDDAPEKPLVTTDDAPEEAQVITDDTSEEDLVGRRFTNSTLYKSAAVSYMGIDRFLNNAGTINNTVDVAVLDSGYDTSCAFVDRNRILTGKAVILDGNSLRDVAGHGTFVLNQIYEATDSAVRFIPVKLTDNREGVYSASTMLAAIYSAVEAGADFINLSAGGDIGYFESFEAGEKALQYALDHQCFLIAAAGNEKRSVNCVWPAKSSRCITVTSISYVTGKPADYSNFGDAIDFAAPGGEDGALIYGYSSGNTLMGQGGTSMAAPYYTAILANLMANGRSYSSLTGLIRSLAGYCDPTLTANASSVWVGNGCVYLPNAINRSITTRAFNEIGSRTYTGSAVTPNPKVTYNGTVLVKDRDYVLSYKNNINPGTAVITVTGRGVYHGSASREFTIVSRNLANASVTTKYRTYDYTGSARRPAVTVTMNGLTLTKDRDYTVTYQGNVGPGLATITVTGIGNYTGTATCRFGLSKRVTDIMPGYAYVLVPKLATGRAAALTDGKMVNNTPLLVSTKTCSEAQQFRIVENADGTVGFVSMRCELAMDSRDGSADSGAAAVIRSYSKSLASEKWILEKNSDGSFLIVNKNSGKVLAAEDGAADQALLRMHTRSGSSAQRFYLEQVSDSAVTRAYEGICTLHSYSNPACVIDVPAASKTSGTVLQIYEANGTAAQQFRLIYSGDGTYRIVNRNSGKVLMPTKSTAVPGAAVVQGTWSGATCQRWLVVEKADGAFVLKNCAGYYLELTGNTAKNGVKLRLNEYASAKRLMWVWRAAA